MWLEVLTGEDAGRVVEVPEGRAFVVGRVQGADLVVRDARASRMHVELTAAGDKIALYDLDSANGTLVDGERVATATLREGQRITIGDVAIAVLAHEPAVTGAPIAEAVRPEAQARAQGPSWSMVGRLVEHRTRRGRRLTYAAVAVAAAAVAALAVVLVTGAGEDERAADTVRAVAPATLRVDASGTGAGGGTGTGWVAGDGLVVTAAHIVNLGTEVTVDGQAAEIAGVAPCQDLALLRLPTTGAPLELAAAGGWEQGETVLALGYPEAALEGEPASSTRGVVSSARTQFRDPAADVPRYAAAIRTDTALDPGFSGGPLVDLDGTVIGVNAAARTTGADGRPLQGANFAIPADRTAAVLERLRRGRSIGWIGASFGYPTVEQLAERKLPPGLFVLGAVPGSGADEAGLGDGGELIAAVDGIRLDGTLSSWCNATRGIRSGQTARLEIVGQDGRTRTEEVRFG
jgi:putative serine protease PepD